MRIVLVASDKHRFWTGELLRYVVATGISLYGDWLTTFALVVLLFRTTGSASGPALYMLARVGPKVVGATPGGVLTDRFGPVRVATACLLVQGALTVAIVATAAAALIWFIYPLVAVAQLINSISQPAYAAMPPRLTAPENLGRVNGLYGALLASSILVSPAIGAFALPHTTPEILIGVDAASFFVAALLIAGVGARDMGQHLERHLPQARLGWQAIARDASLRSGTAAIFGNSAVVTTLQALLVVAAVDHFHHDFYVGWLYAAVGAGGLMGSLLFLRPNPRRIRRRDIVLLAAGEVLALALFVFALNIYVAAALLFLSSLAAVSYQVLSAIAMQQRVPLAVLGRANGARRQAMYIGMLFGAAAAVSLVAPLGWQGAVLVISGCAALVVVLASVTGPRDATPAVAPAEALALGSPEPVLGGGTAAYEATAREA